MTALLANLSWAWRITLGAGAALLVGGAYGAGHIRGYDAGHTAASAKGEALYTALERDHARQYADALAQQAARARQETANMLKAASDLAKVKEEHAKNEQALHRRVSAATRGSTYQFSPDFVRLFNDAVGASVRVHPAGTPAGAGRTAAVAGTGAAVGSGLRGLMPGSGSAAQRLSPRGTVWGPYRASGGEHGTAAASAPASLVATGAAGMANAAAGTGAGAGRGDEPGTPGSGPGTPATGVTERDVLAYIVYYGKRCRDMEAQLRALVRIVGEEK